MDRHRRGAARSQASGPGAPPHRVPGRQVHPNGLERAETARGRLQSPRRARVLVKAYLRSYGLTYLKEEIQAEQVVRKLEPFREFLEVAAQTNGAILNASRIARQIGADVKTVQSYFQILEDTWAGFHLPAYHRSVRKSQASHPKFYLFDTGVKRALERSLDAGLSPGTSAYGDAFEHWVILEFYRLNEYLGKEYKLSYLRTKDGAEIDLVLSKPGSRTILIEIKSSPRVDELEVRKLRRLQADMPGSAAFFLSHDEQAQATLGVRCLPWHRGLAEIFGFRPSDKSSRSSPAKSPDPASTWP